MTITVTDAGELVLALSARVRRQAGFKTGDRLEVRVSPRTITVTAVQPPVYKPTKAELASIRKGEAELARGESVTLSEFLNGLDNPHRQIRPKASRKISRSGR